MTAFVALLRAVNVGGTGRMPMDDLKRLCADAGFQRIRTHIASGNVVFLSDRTEWEVKAALEARLASYAGQAIPVMVRTAGEMAAVLDGNPFPDAAPNRTVAIFLDEPPPAGALDGVAGRNGEEIGVGAREIYVHHVNGMAASRLRIPAAKEGTSRNMNTVATLARMAAELENAR